MTDPPIRFSNNPSSLRRMQPKLGEHSREVLIEAGYTSDQVQKLLETGITLE